MRTQSDRPGVIVRETEPGDFPAIFAISRRVYPGETPWTEAYLASHRRQFPEGQLVAVSERTGEVVGMAASLIVDWDDYATGGSYQDFTGGALFLNHDPSGSTLYGAEVMVDPDAQGLGVGKALYAARRRLCRRLGLARIRAGARIPGYAEVSEGVSASDYVAEVVRGERVDPTLSFQLSQGFRVVAVVGDYLRGDAESRGFGVIIEWVNEEVAPGGAGRPPDPRFEPPPGVWPAPEPDDERGRDEEDAPA